MEEEREGDRDGEGFLWWRRYEFAKCLRIDRAWLANDVTENATRSRGGFVLYM